MGETNIIVHYSRILSQMQVKRISLLGAILVHCRIVRGDGNRYFCGATHITLREVNLSHKDQISSTFLRLSAVACRDNYPLHTLMMQEICHSTAKM